MIKTSLHITLLLLLTVISATGNNFNDHWFLSQRGSPSAGKHASYYLPASPRAYSISILNMNFSADMPYRFDDLFNYSHETNSYFIDLLQLSEQSRKQNRLSFYGNIDWLKIGLNYKGFDIEIAVTDKIFGGFSFNKSFLEFFYFGNAAYMGKETEIDFNITQYHYRSYSLTLYERINRTSNIFVTGNLYFGKSVFNVNPILGIYTDRYANYIDLTVTGKGRVSVPVTLRSFTTNDEIDISAFKYLIGFSNPGLGIGLGLQHRFDNGVLLSASINDLGFIFWHSNTTSFNADSHHRWRGLNISGELNFKELANFTESDEYISVTDTFLNRIIVPDESGFLTLTPTSIHAAALYNVATNFGVGIMFDTRFNNSFVKSNLTATGNLKLLRSLSIYSGVSLSEQLLVSFPAGIKIQGNKAYIALSTYNLLGIFRPDYSQTFGFGINIGFNYLPKSIRYMNHQRLPFYRIKGE